MTWGRYVEVEPERTPEELEELEEARKARKSLRRLGYLLAIGFAVVGLRNCAAMGDAIGKGVAHCEAIVTNRRSG